MVQASLLMELLEVVHGWPHLTLVATYDSRSAHHAGAGCLLVVVAIVASRSYGLLTTLIRLFVPPSSASWMTTSGNTSLLLLGLGKVGPPRCR
jgi:hypothetical protein